MVLFSADLNVIQDSMMKVGDKIARDYIEIENLQNSYTGCEQFANTLVDFIKRKLFEYFANKKPSFDIIFQDENNDDINYDDINFKSDMRYLIDPLCGKINLVHAIPYFATSIALQKRTKDGNYKTICGIIDNPVTQETFIVEHGRGAYVNSRRLRVSSRSSTHNALIAIKNVKDKTFMANVIKKYDNVMVTNCEALNICNVASGKYDITILNKSSIYQELPLLLVKEAGGLIKKLDTGETMVCNGLLYSEI